MSDKKIYVIDSMALIYKAYYAFMNRPLQSSKGEPTSAVYGFFSQIFRILETYRPEYLVLAYDAKEKTFRHEKYELYKSSRAKMPEDLVPQINRIKQIVDLLNIPSIMIPGFEADDIMGTISEKFGSTGVHTYVITPDKDLLQLIDDKTTILRPSKQSDEFLVYTEDKFLEEFGFKPINMIDYLAIIGDTSDDIPGIKGIGEKTAIPLIQRFSTVENIYRNIDELKGAVKSKFECSKDIALLSKDLATVIKNCDIDSNIENYKLRQPNFEEIKNIFVELNFKNLFEKVYKYYASSNELPVIVHNDKPTTNIPDAVPKKYDAEKVTYSLINTLKDAKKFATILSKQSEFVFDTETDSLNFFEANLLGVSFAFREGEAYFVAIDVTSDDEELPVDLFGNSEGTVLECKDKRSNITIDEFKTTFSDIFSDKSIKKICHNVKFDVSILKSAGIKVENVYFDTMLANYVLNPDENHSLDFIAEKLLNYKMIPLTDLIGKEKNPKKLYDVPVNDLSVYSCEDAEKTFCIYNILKKQIAEQGLEKLLLEIEVPLAITLESIEREGIKVDIPFLNNLSNEFSARLETISSDIYAAAGVNFNINSTKQLQEILFNKLGIKPLGKTKTGFSTDAKTLEELRGEHKIIESILEYRTLAKLKSTYTDSLPSLVNPNTGRVHTSFNQTVTSTGRLSSTNPNLQNIPIRTDEGKEIRKAFIARNDEYLLLSADYSQIELRILAEYCKDPALIDAFKKKVDIHKSTASLIYKVPLEEVTSDMRRKAKEVNFGVLYGLGPFGLKNRLGITQYEAKEIIDNYFRTFSSIKNFIEQTKESAHKNGYVETLLGRRRYLANINSKNRVLAQFEERAAVNMPIQGTAADLIKIAMVRIQNEFNAIKCKSKLLLQVHDELVFDLAKDEVNEIPDIIKNIMESSLKTEVPLLTEIGIGDNWLDAH